MRLRAPRPPPHPPNRTSKDSRTRGGDSSLAYGSRALDASSEEDGSGDEDSADESVSVSDLYSSATQRLSGALDVLFEVAPDMFSDVTDPSHVGDLSAIEEVLGCSSDAHALPLLRESRVVTSALRAAFKSVAGFSASVSDRGLPRFLQISRPWFQQTRCLRFRRELLPDAPLVVSQEEKETMGSKVRSPAVTLPDKCLSVWEAQLLSSLKTLSLADALLSGVGKLVVSPDDEIPGPSTSKGEGGGRQEDLFLLLSSLGQCVSSLASGLSASYTNVVLARRDAHLGGSTIPPQVRGSLRILPLSDSLFGPQVSEMIHQASERARDLAFLRPPRAPAPFSQGSQAGRGKRRRFGGRGGGSPPRKRAKQSYAPRRDAAPARSAAGRGRAKALPPQ